MTDTPAPPDSTPLQMQINMPPEHEAGVHADFVQAWQINESFVLDFATFLQPPLQATNNDTQQQVMLLPARIVARVRLDPTQIPGLITTLQEQHRAYEENRNRSTLNQKLEDLMHLPPVGDTRTQ